MEPHSSRCVVCLEYTARRSTRSIETCVCRDTRLCRTCAKALDNRCPVCREVGYLTPRLVETQLVPDLKRRLEALRYGLRSFETKYVDPARIEEALNDASLTLQVMRSMLPLLGLITSTAPRALMTESRLEFELGWRKTFQHMIDTFPEKMRVLMTRARFTSCNACDWFVPHATIPPMPR